jgi:hypothetical protein
MPTRSSSPAPPAPQAERLRRIAAPRAPGYPAADPFAGKSRLPFLRGETAMKTMTSALLAAASLLAAMPLAGCTGANEGFPGGMRVERLQSNRWTLYPGRLDFDDANLQVRTYYRAAVIAKANGYDWFQVVDYDEGPLGLGTGTKVQVVGVRERGAPLTCLAEAEWAHKCVVRSVEESFRDYGPQLGKTRAQIDEEVRVEAIPVPAEAPKKK